MTVQTVSANHNAKCNNLAYGPVIFGEVLFDIFPDGSRVLGGAPFNVAWHCQAFGLSPLFVSRVGNDPLGFAIRRAMLNWGMDTAGLQMDSSYPTGIVNVNLQEDEPAYEIVADRAWDYIHSDAFPPIKKCSLLYHDSLILRHSTSAFSLKTLKQICSGSVFVDVNIRPPWWKKTYIEQLMNHHQWIKLNEEELNLLVPQERFFEDKIHYLLSERGVDLVIVTRGKKGVIAVTATLNQYIVKPEPAIRVVDTAGAGDAFSSVMIVGKIKHWDIQVSLQRAQNFASAIVGQRGAIVHDKHFYQFFIDAWGI